ncbi:MAG: HDOD domain-containing protein [Steroidobacteraceae bacterium]
MAEAARSSGTGRTAAFDFVQALAGELSSKNVELPSFPDVAIRVRQVLSDESIELAKVVRVVGSEPNLAARILQMANSAAIGRGSRAVTEVRAAIARIGFNMVRSAAIAFAMAQVRKAKEYQHIQADLQDHWKRSAQVAALSFVIARNFTRVNSDTAMLAGLLHSVGKLYLLTRAQKYPELFSDKEAYNTIVAQWHANVAKGLLETWGMAEEIVTAVYEHEDLERGHEGETDLTDVLTVAGIIADHYRHVEQIPDLLRGVYAATRMGLDEGAINKIIAESADEIAAIKSALSG